MIWGGVSLPHHHSFILPHPLIFLGSYTLLIDMNYAHKAEIPTAINGTHVMEKIEKQSCRKLKPAFFE